MIAIVFDVLGQHLFSTTGSFLAVLVTLWTFLGIFLAVCAAHLNSSLCLHHPLVAITNKKIVIHANLRSEGISEINGLKEVHRLY